MKKIIFSILMLIVMFTFQTNALASESSMTVESSMECVNFEEHIQMIKEHRLEVIIQYKNGEISQEKFVMHIQHINKMINMHQ